MRSTPALLVIFILVLHRWFDMRSGWSEWVIFPLLGIIGTLLVDRLVLPPGSRLDSRAWAVNIAIAGAVAALMFMLGQ